MVSWVVCPDGDCGQNKTPVEVHHQEVAPHVYAAPALKCECGYYMLVVR